MSMNKSREIAGVIRECWELESVRELMEVSVEAIGEKLPLLLQTLSQLVEACWFFLSKSNAQFFKEKEKSRILSGSHVVNLVQLHNSCMCEFDFWILSVIDWYFKYHHNSAHSFLVRTALYHTCCSHSLCIATSLPTCLKLSKSLMFGAN